jgi:hypothetical protein
MMRRMGKMETRMLDDLSEEPNSWTGLRVMSGAGSGARWR